MLSISSLLRGGRPRRRFNLRDAAAWAGCLLFVFCGLLPAAVFAMGRTHSSSIARRATWTLGVVFALGSLAAGLISAGHGLAPDPVTLPASLTTTDWSVTDPPLAYDPVGPAATTLSGASLILSGLLSIAATILLWIACERIALPRTSGQETSGTATDTDTGTMAAPAPAATRARDPRPTIRSRLKPSLRPALGVLAVAALSLWVSRAHTRWLSRHPQPSGEIVWSINDVAALQSPDKTERHDAIVSILTASHLLPGPPYSAHRPAAPTSTAALLGQIMTFSDPYAIYGTKRHTEYRRPSPNSTTRDPAK